MPVQKNILEQYNSIKLEIKDLERRIKDHEKQIKLLEQETVCDVVKGSRADLSYGAIKVEGIAQSEIDWHWNLIHERTAQLQNYKKKLEEMKFVIEDYIEMIPDSEIRRIARFRYLDDLEWRPVAKCMGVGYTDDACRQKLSRYLKSSRGAA